MSFLNKGVRNIDTEYTPIDCLPGDCITSKVTKLRKDIDLGHGLEQIDDEVVCTHAGVLRYRAPAHYFIEDNYRTILCPKVGDQVVGIVEDRGSEFYKINIFTGSPATLNRLAFEGATKRNRPDLKRGDVVYCRILNIDKDVDIELTCISSSGVKKDWASGEAIYGSLVAGLIIKVPPSYSNKMLHPQNIVLNSLGKNLPFEVAIGMNGAIWFKANSPAETIIIRNCILNAQSMDDPTTIEAMVEVLIARFHKDNK